MLFVFAYQSEVSLKENFNFNKYNKLSVNYIISDIPYAEPPPYSPSILIQFTEMNLNESQQTVQYKYDLYIWLKSDFSNISFSSGTYNGFKTQEPWSTQSHQLEQIGSVSNGGSNRYWIYTTKEPVEEYSKVYGFSQQYPYDFYSIPLDIGIGANSNESSYPLSLPILRVSVSAPELSGWKTDAYSISDNYMGTSVSLQLVYSRDTSVAILQFMLPTIAIYFLIGCYLFTNSSDKMRDRISLGLTIGVITLSLYTFLLRQANWLPLFIQNLAVSLVVSNIILLSFSILFTGDKRRSRKWELFPMLLSSITPILYLFVSAYNLMGALEDYPEYLLANRFFSYLDYRFLLWFIIFQLFFWALYLHKQKVLGFVTFFVGLGILALTSIKVDVPQDLTFSIIGIIMILAPIILYLSNFRKTSSHYDYDLDY